MRASRGEVSARSIRSRRGVDRGAKRDDDEEAGGPSYLSVQKKRARRRRRVPARDAPPRRARDDGVRSRTTHLRSRLCRVQASRRWRVTRGGFGFLGRLIDSPPADVRGGTILRLPSIATFGRGLACSFCKGFSRTIPKTVYIDTNIFVKLKGCAA